MQRQIPPGRAFSCAPPTLAPNLAALSVTCNLRRWKGSLFWFDKQFGKMDGGPLKPALGLSGDVHISPSVIPTGPDHREGSDLRSGGTLCLMFASDGSRSSRNGDTRTRKSG